MAINKVKFICNSHTLQMQILVYNSQNTFVLAFCLKLKKEKTLSLKSFTRNDETFIRSDRFLLILSFSGGARGVIFPSSSIKLPPSEPLHTTQSQNISLYLTAHHFSFLWCPFLLHSQRPATGCSVGSPSGECNYKEGRVETFWRAYEGAAAS